MKEIKYILLTLVCILFASCMGENYADPEEGEIPYGNLDIDAINVITIEQLKQKYAHVISSNGMTEITEDIQLLGRVTGNDIGGNIYNEFALQDETGAILICINQSALYGALPVGQQVLVSLKGLIIGGYGQQPEIGGIYTNTKTGAQSVGRMSRYTWDSHYKLFGKPDLSSVKPETFDLSKIADESYIAANCGKLMTIKNVRLKDADGKAVFAPDDGSISLTANAANRAFSGISSSSMVLRTSTYAEFANEVMPQGELAITGIFTRYRNTWQILIRTLDDIEVMPTAIFSETFMDGQGSFSIVDVNRPDDLTYIWSHSSRYSCMLASAYKDSQNYESESWLISPAIDLSSVNKAKLLFSQAANYFGGECKDDCSVWISTDYESGLPSTGTWTKLDIATWPANDFKFVDADCDLTAYAGKKNVRIAFKYTSPASKAGNWEVKNVVIE